MNSIVVHYNELALKGRNRPWFVQMLVRNIRIALTGLGVPAVRSIMGRIEIELGPAQWTAIRERLRTVFGIAYYSYAGTARLDLDAMAETILGDLDGRQPSSFRVTARRTDKRYPLTSPQIEYEVGGRI
ncbi:MAG TPA: THUMP domain-containing protein, partial [Vicinamibacterales bacterium]|nr:THUMP domain-containing protein [Vicinamibacterales bacterium]